MKELKSLSKTRWCSQAEACDAVIATLGSIIDCVEFFAEDNNPDRRAAAEVIVGFVDTDFIVNLVLFQDILRKSSMTANYLQSKEMDTAKAVELISALKANLMREDLFEEVWIRVVQLITKHDIAPPIERRRRSCREDSNQRIWTKDDYKIKLFDTVIGEFVKELDIRFDDEVSCILKAMTAMNPLSNFFLNFEIMMPFVEQYEIRKELLRSELEVFKEQYNNTKQECKSILDVLQFVYPHRVVIPSCTLLSLLLP